MEPLQERITQTIAKISKMAVNANIQEQYKMGINAMPQMILFPFLLDHILNLLQNAKWQWLASIKAARN